MADNTGTPNTIPHAAGNGQIQELTAAQITTKYGAALIKTPTKNFTLNYRGMHLACFKNIPVVCDAALIAAFAATGAPVV